jgi:hypothetical protein
MVAFLTSDVFRKFMGGFVIGTVAILVFHPASAHSAVGHAPVQAVTAASAGHGAR